MAKTTGPDAARTPERNEQFGQKWQFGTTINQAKEAIRKLIALGIPVVSSHTIPITPGAQADDISLESVVEDYGVDPAYDLIDVYIRVRGVSGPDAHVVGQVLTRLKDAEATGIVGYTRLYQSFYPGADATGQMLQLPFVADAIRVAIQKA
jgi:hypothetical protein